MVNIGDIVEFRYKERQIVAQVVATQNVWLQVKINNTNEFVQIDNYFRAYSSGTLIVRRHFSKEMIFLCKTVVVILQVMGQAPTRYQRLKAWLKWQRWKNDRTVWVLKARVRGTMFFDGFFIPHRHQPISGSLYYHQYNKLHKWNKLQDN